MRGRLVPREIMGAIYRAILDRIERRDYDVFCGRPRAAAAPRADRRGDLGAETMHAAGRAIDAAAGA